MSEQDSNKQVVRAYLEALGKGDAAGVGATLSPDTQVIAIGTSFMSGTRNYDDVVSTVGMLKSITQNGIAFHIDSLTAEDNRVVAEVHGTSTLVDGTPYNQEYLFLFHFQDGKVTRLVEHFCTKRTEECFGPLMAAQAG